MISHINSSAPGESGTVKTLKDLYHESVGETLQSANPTVVEQNFTPDPTHAVVLWTSVRDEIPKPTYFPVFVSPEPQWETEDDENETASQEPVRERKSRTWETWLYATMIFIDREGVAYEIYPDEGRSTIRKYGLTPSGTREEGLFAGMTGDLTFTKTGDLELQKSLRDDFIFVRGIGGHLSNPLTVGNDRRTKTMRFGIVEIDPENADTMRAIVSNMTGRSEGDIVYATNPNPDTMQESENPPHIENMQQYEKIATARTALLPNSFRKEHPSISVNMGETVRITTTGSDGKQKTEYLPLYTIRRKGSIMGIRTVTEEIVIDSTGRRFDLKRRNGKAMLTPHGKDRAGNSVPLVANATNDIPLTHLIPNTDIPGTSIEIKQLGHNFLEFTEALQYMNTQST